MQNMDGIAANQGGGLRELSLAETEMVGGGFSWGGLVHGVEHVAGDAVHAAASGVDMAVAAGTMLATSKAAKWAWKEVKSIKPPKPPSNPAPALTPSTSEIPSISPGSVDPRPPLVAPGTLWSTRTLL